MLKKHYARLGLKKGAGKKEVKKAYRRLAMKYHPDRNAHPSAEQKFMAINVSYEIICDYLEGGAPTYNQISPEEVKKTTYYHNSKFTVEEMERAWERQRAKERSEYERYLNLPWYHPTRLFEYFLYSFTWLFVLIIVLPIMAIGVVVMINVSFFAGLMVLLVIIPPTIHIIKILRK